MDERRIPKVTLKFKIYWCALIGLHREVIQNTAAQSNSLITGDQVKVWFLSTELQWRLLSSGMLHGVLWWTRTGVFKEPAAFIRVDLSWWQTHRLPLKRRYTSVWTHRNVNQHNWLRSESWNGNVTDTRWKQSPPCPDVRLCIWDVAGCLSE